MRRKLREDKASGGGLEALDFDTNILSFGHNTTATNNTLHGNDARDEFDDEPDGNDSGYKNSDAMKETLQVHVSQMVLQEQSWTNPAGGSDLVAVISSMEIRDPSFLEAVDASSKKEELCLLRHGYAVPLDKMELLGEVIADMVDACIVDASIARVHHVIHMFSAHILTHLHAVPSSNIQSMLQSKKSSGHIV